MIVRIIDRHGTELVSGELIDAWPSPSSSKTDHDAVRSADRGRDVGEFKTSPRTALATVRIPMGTKLPLWYGGMTDTHGTTTDFSLPSGLHNVWGCGNDFDTDAFMIHPEDLPGVISAVKKRA